MNEIKDELESIKMSLKKDGFDPEMTLCTLSGFYFSGSIFQGSHRMGEDKLRKNVGREVDLSDPVIAGRFEKTVGQLKKEGVINDAEGVSITPHIANIRNAALRDMVSYIRAHRFSSPLD